MGVKVHHPSYSPIGGLAEQQLQRPDDGGVRARNASSFRAALGLSLMACLNSTLAHIRESVGLHAV